MLYGNNYSKGQYGVPFSNNYLPAAGGGADSLLTGLSCWVSMDEASGNRVDSSVNGLVFTQVGTVPSVAGKINNGIATASSQYLRNQTDMEFFDATTGTGMSVSFWVKASTFSHGRPILGRKNSNLTANKLWDFFMYDGSNPSMAFNYGTGGSCFPPVPDSWFTVDTWHHIVARVSPGDNSLIEVIVNNRTSAYYTDTVFTHKTDIAVPLTLGWTYSNSFVDGNLDEFALWQRVISDDEVSRLYNSGAGMGYPG